jgi:Uma2 family endonuclease
MNVAVADPTSPHGVRLSVRDFLLLVDNGAFDTYSKSELIDGEIVCVNSQFRPHAMAKGNLFVALVKALEKMDSSLTAIVEVGVKLDDGNLFEPDIVLIDDEGDERVVPGETVVLAVEVSDTTLRHDLVRKARFYSLAGVPEYWVLDVNARILHQLWKPGPDGFGERREIKLGGLIEAVTIPDLRIETDRV